LATSSITRLTGLASGMDTDSIVKKLMDVEKIPLNRLKQTQQKQTWMSDMYRQWNADLLSFRTNTLLNMKLSGAYNTFDVTSSNPNSISGTAATNAITGTYSVAVKQLADSATLTGNNVVLDPTKTLGNEVQGARQLTANTSININVYNDPTNPTVSQTANIAINTTDTINDVVSKINSAMDANGKSLGLQAIYDPNMQQFIMKTKATGESVKIDLSANTDPASLQFLNNTLGVGTLTATGKNADIIVNGKEINTITSNDVKIMGINFSLKNTTIDANGQLTTNTVTVSQSVDTVVKNVKDFVDKYNDLLDKMNKAVTESVYKDYQPLTDDQRSELSEKQIEMWESKAKSGLLRGDSIFNGLINKMRNSMSSIVSNGSSFNTLASIGISSTSYQDRGKLYVDETKLREAIQTDPGAVEKLFSQSGDTALGTNGLINQLADVMNQGIKDLTAKAGSTANSQYDQSVIGRLLSKIQTDITRQTEKLSRKETQYYSQFSAMETAITKYNSQSSWLSQQISSG